MERGIKVILLGDGKVGKTSIIKRFTTGDFEQNLNRTVDAMQCQKKIKIGNIDYKLSIWDTAGQEEYSSIASMYYRDAQGAVLVYDLTVRESFTRVDFWLKQLSSFVPECI